MSFRTVVSSLRGAGGAGVGSPRREGLQLYLKCFISPKKKKKANMKKCKHLLILTNKDMSVSYSSISGLSVLFHNKNDYQCA